MAVELPEPLQWVLLLLAGTRWPEADEDMLREMAERWREGAKTLEDAGRSADAALKRALDGQRGAAADALAQHWAQFTTGKGTEQDPGYFPGLVQACNGMGDMLEAMANSAETAKIQIVAQLGILAFEIATAEAEAPFTAGASLAEIPVFVGVSRTAVQQILKTLLKEALEFAAKQAAQMAAINLLAQGIEVMEGHRKGIDMKELGQNALGGAVAGASGHLIGKGLSGAGSKLGLSSVMETTAGRMAHGAAVGVGADVSTQLITTGHVDGNSLLGSGLSGGAAVGLHTGAAAVKGHFNGPPKIPTPHAGPEGAGGGAGGAGHGTGGAPVFSKPDPATSGYRGPAGEGAPGGGTHDAPVTGGSPGAASAGGGHTSAGEGGTGGGAARTEGASAPASGTRGLVPFGSDRPSSSADRSPSAETQSPVTERPAPAEGTPAPAAHRTETPAVHDGPSPAPTRAETSEPAPRTAEPTPRVAESQPESGPRGAEPAPAAHDRVNEPVHQQVQEPVRDQPAAQPGQEPTRTVPVDTTGVHDGRPTTAEPASTPVDRPVAERVPAADHPSPTPVHEGPAPVHESPAPVHESPAPVHGTAVPLHDGPAPTRDTPVPAHEASVPAHEAPATVHPAAGPAHEGPALAVHEAPAAAPTPGTERPAPAVHEAPAAAAPTVHATGGGGGERGTPLSEPDAPAEATSRLDGTGLPAGLSVPTTRTSSADHTTSRPSDTPPPPPTSQDGPPQTVVPAGVGGPVPVAGAGVPHAAPQSTPHAAPPSGSRSAPRPPEGTAAGGLGPVRPATGRVPSGTDRAPGGGGLDRPLRPQDAETIHQTERDQRRAELDALRRSNDGAVARAAEQLGQQQVFTATRPPEAEQLVRDVPRMSADERINTIDTMRPEYRRWLAKDPTFVDSLRSELTPGEFARTAAHLVVDVDRRTSRPASARAEAHVQAERMLQDPDVAAALLKSGAGMVVVPKDVAMTDVNAFHHLKGTTAEGASGGGRGWDDVRGSGGRRAAVTEENLLGEDTSIGSAPHYQDGYSTTTHEFAHTIHQHALSQGDRDAITASYQKKYADPNATWSDGPRHDTHGNAVDNYGSRDELEYFAQVTNAYLGTNHGTDPHTGQPRNNGPEWVRANEPDLLPVLERLYGPDPTAVHQEPANPVTATRADNGMYQGFREFMERVDPVEPGTHTPAEHTPPPPTPRGGPAVPGRDHPTPPPPPNQETSSHPEDTSHNEVTPHDEDTPHQEDTSPQADRLGNPPGMDDHQTAESEFRLGTAALLEQTVVERLAQSGLDLPEGALVLGGGGGVAAVQLHRPVQDLDMRLTFDGDTAGRSNQVLDFLAREVLTDGEVVAGRRDTATTVRGQFGGLDVSITLSPVSPQEHQMHVVVNGETHNGETVPLKVVASEDLLGDKLAALAMRKQDATVNVAMLREKRLRDATDVLTLYSKLEPGALDRLRTDRESLRPAIGKLADVVAEVDRHSHEHLTEEQHATLREIATRLGSEPTPPRPAKQGKPIPTKEEIAALKAKKEEAKRLKAAQAAGQVPGQPGTSSSAAPHTPTSGHTDTRPAPDTPTSGHTDTRPAPDTPTSGHTDTPAPPPAPRTVDGTGTAPRGTDSGRVSEVPPPPPPPPTFRTGPVARGGHTPPPPPPPTAAGTHQGGPFGVHGDLDTVMDGSGSYSPTDHSMADDPMTGHLGDDPMTGHLGDDPMSDHDMEVDAAPAAPVAPPRRPLAVAVQTVVDGPVHGPLRGQDVYLSEVIPSNDRPMTRFGTDQRSHTVPWALTRRAAGGLAGRSADVVWRELKADITEFQKYPPTARGAARQDHPMVMARWADIVRRLGELPDVPPPHQSLEEWHRNLGDLVSGYIEISQLTSFASFADGRAVGHGEAAMLERLTAHHEGRGPEPHTDDVVRTLLDIKQNSSLPAADAQAAKEHLIRTLHRAYPSYMTPGRRQQIEQMLGLRDPVRVVDPGVLPNGVARIPRYPLRSDLVSDISADPHDPSVIGRIMLSEQSRPDTKFGSDQMSHAASWSLMRASLLSFEGRPHQDLKEWLGGRFDEMHELPVLDADSRAAVDHARNEIARLDGYPAHERPARLGDLVRVFVSAHQKLPHTTFADGLQHGRATASGELDLGMLGGPRHHEVVASHFDGAAPFNSKGDDLVRSYRSWRTMAETLGPVGPDTIALLADRSFTEKNMEQLIQAGRLRPMEASTAQKYLEGFGEWDRAVSTAFPEHGPTAVTNVWGRYREEFTLDRFGQPSANAAPQLEAWFAQVRQAPRPSAAAAALAGLAKYYEVRSTAGRRGNDDGALAAARAAAAAV